MLEGILKTIWFQSPLGHLLLDQVAPSPIQPGLQQFKGCSIHVSLKHPYLKTLNHVSTQIYNRLLALDGGKINIGYCLRKKKNSLCSLACFLKFLNYFLNIELLVLLLSQCQPKASWLLVMDFLVITTKQETYSNHFLTVPSGHVNLHAN